MIKTTRTWCLWKKSNVSGKFKNVFLNDFEAVWWWNSDAFMCQDKNG